jgi:hypothetical protein
LTEPRYSHALARTVSRSTAFGFFFPLAPNANMREEASEFVPKDNDIIWRVNSQPNLAALNVHHRDRDVVADVDFLAQFSGQHKHASSSVKKSMVVR